MNDITGNKLSKTHILYITLATVAGVWLLFIFTGVNGVGMSPDSAQYIAAARSLIQGEGFLDVSGNSIVAWPPFYSIFAANFRIFQIDYQAIMKSINIFSFAIIIFTSSIWILINTKSMTLSLINSIMIVFSKPLFHVITHGWSEPLFIAEICLFMLILTCCTEKMDYKMLLLAVAASSASITRYPGITLIPIGCLYVFFKLKDKYSIRILKMVLWGFFASAPLVIWLARNYALTKTFTGERVECSLTLSHNLELTGKVISVWFLPLSLSQIMSGWVVFTLLIIILLNLTIFITYKFLVRKINPFSFPLTVPFLFICFYGFMIILSVTKTVLSPLSDRYLSPLFVPLLFILLYFLYIAMQSIISNGKKLKNTSVKFTMLISLAIFTGVWLASEINIVTAQAYTAYYKGYDGFNEKSYQQSELFGWLKENKLEGKLYSNSPCSLFIWTTVESELPAYKYLADGGTDEISRKKSKESVISFKNTLEKNGKVYLIWRLPNIRKNLYEPNELQQFCNMKLLKKFSDGFIFELYNLSGNQLNK